MCLECMFTVPGEATMASNVLGPVDAWIARTHDIITHRGGTSVCSTLPIHAYAGRCIGFCVLHPYAVTRIRGTVRGCATMDSVGFEPTASSLQRRHSAAEL